MEVVVESLEGAGRIVGALLARPLRARRTTWGATAAEVARTFPGDELAPSPAWSYTHAVTVAAPPAQVWPWLAQIGQGRGGFYSYQGLENLVGCRIRNTSVVLDEFAHIEVGDEVKLHPRAPGLRVTVAEPGRSLVLFGGAESSLDASVWGFHLAEAGDGKTRLIERGHYAHGPGFGSRLMSGPTVLEPISFVMSRKMLLRIAELAGSSAPDLPRYHVDGWRAVVNRVMTTLLHRGAAPDRMVLLETLGRRSGLARSTPVYVTELDGQRFLVAPYGAVGWVHNVRAHPHVTLHRGRRAESLTVSEVDASTAAPVLAKYHSTVTVTRPYFRAQPGAGADELALEADLHPVFRLSTASPATGATSVDATG